jgi:short-subunit dehydrogenase
MKKRIIVTGGTKGLGRAIAEYFAKYDFDVCVCARTQSDLNEMSEQWQKILPEATLLTFAADLSKKSELLEFGAYINTHWPTFDILVNNAGLFLPGLVTEEPDGTLQTLIETNLYSAYYLTRAILPGMLSAKKGHIFNMCSVASLMAYPNGGSYSISKYALLGFSKALREELKSKGIRVTAVMPGATWSDSWHGVDLPHERLMDASDIAKIIYACYTLSDAAVVEDLVIRPQLGDL